MAKTNIVLVGFMGTGKTAVAQKIADILKMYYLDVDNLIEEREQRKIVDIFAASGEEYFRKVERAIVSDISKKENLVAACGGGVVLNKANMDNLHRNGIIICLSARPEIILERTADYRHRPLLNVADPLKQVKQLLEKRARYYAQADVTIDTSDLSIDQVIEQILAIGGVRSMIKNGMQPQNHG
ncbi:MAG: RNase adapter RapZ [Candidatus Omnitrophota bacterium]